MMPSMMPPMGLGMRPYLPQLALCFASCDLQGVCFFNPGNRRCSSRINIRVTGSKTNPHKAESVLFGELMKFRRSGLWHVFSVRVPLNSDVVQTWGVKVCDQRVASAVSSSDGRPFQCFGQLRMGSPYGVRPPWAGPAIPPPQRPQYKNMAAGRQ